ncbi:MAG: alkaline phosphatase family protein [gamma proteobacterium endosymbiont of Lamellibrachia anaximandri]|nr:alkaline phosphatase family protein [gamma proteobacterium endosymbiont of Lamellibrachia anaximandri]MBL3534782.1 alkaline phosphatase family protein [gamma proteobacterium endosymbiont of Lamellibrachia anaximandri]
MSRPLVVIDIVGLTPALLGEETPHLTALVNDGFMATLEGVFPAVTCTAQASMLTGLPPSGHGIVANGWYFRDLAEIWLWRQSNHLVQGEKVWDAARSADAEFTCAKLFWWHNMYADVDWSATPRPIYPADGRKIPGIYTEPPTLKQSLQEKLGPFPMFNFWGPASDIRSSAWIAQSAKEVFDTHRPGLSLVYLPHLDYNLQRLGPDNPAIHEDLRQIDQVAGELIEHVRAQGAEVMVVSEYGIEQTTGSVDINRILREAGFLRIQETLGWELLDPGASRAFAVADHQVAHVYLQRASDLQAVKNLLEKMPGIERVLDAAGKKAFGIDHQRAGELVAIAEPGHWFTYYYWLDENKAPDFAPTVDIHRKPGYDPAELFLDPKLHFPKLRITRRLLQKKLGFRTLLDVIPTQADQVQGTHGRLANGPKQGPLLIGSDRSLAADAYAMTDIKQLILRALAS